MSLHHVLEPLEPRLALAAFSFESLFENLGYNTPILNIEPPPGSLAQGFGSALAGLGDIDADGTPDLAVAAGPGVFGSSDGEVSLFSGASGSLIRTLSDGSESFGASLANVGDVNGDGVPDLVVGSPRYDGDGDLEVDPTGAVWVYSGADGSVIRSIVGAAANDNFGAAVAALPRASGAMTIAVGAPQEFGPNMLGGPGRVSLYAGDTGELLTTFEGNQAGEGFGHSLAAAPAWAGFDGAAPMLAIGAPFAHTTPTQGDGRVVVLSRDGQVLDALEGEVGELLGSSVAFMRTHVAPGFAVLAGAPGANSFGGAVHVLGEAAPLALPFLPNGRWGSSISNVGDVNGDGQDDALIGTGRALGAQARVFATADPNLGIVIHDDVPSAVGSRGAPVGDFDNDGIAEILTSGAGGVHVVSTAGMTTEVVDAGGTGQVPRISGATPDGRFMWINDGSRPMLITDGQIRLYSRIQGLSASPDFSGTRSEVLGVGPAGEILFVNVSGPSGDIGEVQLLTAGGGGAVAPISSRFVTVDGGPDNLTPVAANMQSGELSPDGRFVLLREGLVSSPLRRIWLLDLTDGSMRFLWEGTAGGVNSSGVVVGARAAAGGGQVDGVVRAASGEVTAVPQFVSILAVNEAGDALGLVRSATGSPTLGILAGGVVTDIGAPVENEVSPPQYDVLHFDDQHRVIVEVRTGSGESAERTLFLRTTEDGFVNVPDAVHGQGTREIGFRDASLGDRPLGASWRDDGTIVTYGAVLAAVEPESLFKLRDGSKVATVAGPEGEFITGVNVYDELVVMQRGAAQDPWTGRRLALGPIPRTAGIVMFTDPGASDQAYVAVADDETLRVYRAVDELPSAPPLNSVDGVLTPPPSNYLSVVTNAAGVAHLVGVDDNGDLLMFFRAYQIFPDAIDPTQPSGWIQVNISEDHLEPQGISTPPIGSEFSSMVTPWGAVHLATLDLSTGHVVMLWWAPGMVQWRVDDLMPDQGPGGTQFTGPLTAFATPWGTLHVNGVDQTGTVTAVWWAPGFGGDWRIDPLVPSGLELLPRSLGSYVTPWGGLTITGVLADGRAAVYWWSPDSNGWHADPLVVRPPPDALPVLDATVRPAARSEGAAPQNIVARGDDGSVLLFDWNIGDAGMWNLMDVTAETAETA